MSKFEGPRGLVGYARVETAEQQTVEVQQSSAVLSMTINAEVEGPFVWLRVKDPEAYAAAHLTVEEAREIRDALSAWLADFGGEQADREPTDDEALAGLRDQVDAYDRDLDAYNEEALRDAAAAFLAAREVNRG